MRKRVEMRTRGEYENEEETRNFPSRLENEQRMRCEIIKVYCDPL